MKKYFYEETGMYIDWQKLSKLPEIDTLIDIGVGDEGTPDLYDRFPQANLILIDPLEEAEKYVRENLSNRNHKFIKCGLGEKHEEKIINVEESIGRSTILNVTDINYEGLPIDKRKIILNSLDSIVSKENNLGRIGIKIDTEGYELNVIKGSKNTLKSTDFVLAEVRHNHLSFDNQYMLHDFMNAMNENGFILSIIFTAKPLIADLCFQPKDNLIFKN